MTAGVAKSYGPVVALRSVDLTVRPGEVHALLGANGAGKSTLVKILTGVIGRDAGSIEVSGEPVDFSSPTDAHGVGLATVFQDPALIPDLTVADNLRLTGVDADRVAEWLERMGLGGTDLDEQVKDLPLPLLRMLDLARALAQDPQVLFLDEITAALPADLAERVFELMAEWRARNRAVLFISHRLGEVMEHCDQATVLRDGRNVATFPPAEGGEERLVQAMLGEEVAAEASHAGGHERPPSTDVPALEARELGFGNDVTGVSFEVAPGEILGIAALEGQGQDRLFELLSGDMRPQSGSILVEGVELRARSPYDAIRRGVVLVPSDRLLALLPQRSVRENLATPLYNRISRWGPIRRGRETARVDAAVRRLSIDTRAASQVRRLSGGNQQKVTIGRWLAAGFDTLLCFDPTRGIDVGTKHQIYELLRELAAEGTAVILYTSELAEIPIVCDRVMVLYGGRVVDQRPAAGADEETLLTAAHGVGEGAA